LVARAALISGFFGIPSRCSSTVTAIKRRFGRHLGLTEMRVVVTA
jgi:hypothetical protein